MKDKAKQTMPNLSLAKLTKNYNETPQADVLAVIIWIGVYSAIRISEVFQIQSILEYIGP
jgi:hypothetical protein